ncbi:MAG: hypothetical protein JXB49_31545 [Bacteroidales bacterium]|nr:hypothetical protein [Bacteroidales bacterium]
MRLIKQNVVCQLKKHYIFISIYLTVLVFSIFKHAAMPPLWFDEGWTLSLARNWIELGHYGQLLSGEPIPLIMLNTGFPLIVLHKLSFKFLGIGLWQARIPGVVVVLIVYVLIYLLLNKLYNSKIGNIFILLSLLAPVNMDLHPIILGRRVLGEMLVVLLVILGYVLLYYIWHRQPIFLLFPAFIWALALVTKPQVIPFYFFSHIFVLVYFYRSKPVQRKIILILVSSMILYLLIVWGWSLYTSHLAYAENQLPDSYQMANYLNNLQYYVIVFIKDIRIDQLIKVFLGGYGLLSTLGVVWFAFQLWQNRTINAIQTRKGVIIISLWGFSFSWIMWYIFLSIGWPRYAFPGVFLGHIFTSLLIADLFNIDNIKIMFLEDFKSIRNHHFPYRGIFFAILFAVFILNSYRTIHNIWDIYLVSDSAILDVTDYLNTVVKHGDTLETYESELFFLLDSPYHYPPDSVQHNGNRRMLLGHDVEIAYDPKKYDPDFIVVGWANNLWHIYDEIIASGRYHLVYEKEIYQIYKKVE